MHAFAYLDHIELYRDVAGKYRWRRVAMNKNIIADSGQGYRSKYWAKRMAKKINPDLLIEDHTK